MFTGRPRRGVNLGSRKQASAHDVLKNAEQQRQKREKQRVETNAVLSLQRAWRALALRDSARYEYAMAFARSDTVAFHSADELAWLLPSMPRLSSQQCCDIVTQFLRSDVSHSYSKILVQRLPTLWSINDSSLHALAVRVLQNQRPPEVPIFLLKTILESDKHAQNLQWLAQTDPRGVLVALLELNSAELIANLPGATLALLYQVDNVPPIDQALCGDALLQLLYRAVLEISSAWPLVVSLVLMMFEHWHITNPTVFSSQLVAKTVINAALDSSPLLLARYAMALLYMFPRAKPTILLQLSLARSPSPLTKFWPAFKTEQAPNDRETLLHITIEMYSYWLLVATDAELVSNESLGLNIQDLWDFAITIRDRSFEVLWDHNGRKSVVTGTMASTLKVLRQLYTRDSRMQLFPQNFWLLDAIPQKFFVQHLDSVGSIFEEEDADDDEDDEDDDDEGNEDNFVGMQSGTRGRSSSQSLKPRHTRFKETKIRLKANPALRILELAPFFVPFETRVALFYRFIAKDRAAQPHTNYRHHFDINRETLVEDARLAFASLGSRVKTELQVRLFANGVPEAGVDGGGLTRELLMAICEEVFNQQTPTQSSEPAFVETLNHTLAPNPIFGESPKYMTPLMNSEFFFLGQVIGKCLYENLLVNVEFAPFFLSKWNKHSSNGYSIKSSFDDLSLLDYELYRNISKLHSIHGAAVDALGLDFTVVNTQQQVAELKPHGASIPVTESNKLEFMRELANYKLNTSLKPQTTWFVLGLSQLIRLEWLNMFNPFELNKLISGETKDFDIEDLKRNVELYDFTEESPTIAYLWDVLMEFEPDQRAEFLKFITSVPRAPLLGFSKLEPRLGIRFAGFDDDRLPTSSTCVNLLKLPAYSTKRILKEKLLYSLEAKAGFELS